METDWRLFTTLIRFDAVYAIHFKCSLQKISEYEHLWPYLRDLYQWPGIAETVKFDQIRAHYYGTHPMINPKGIVALQPRQDLNAPHGREALAAERTRGFEPATRGPVSRPAYMRWRCFALSGTVYCSVTRISRHALEGPRRRHLRPVRPPEWHRLDALAALSRGLGGNGRVLRPVHPAAM